MTKKTRTILFISLVIFFLLIAPSIIFYSQGYRFDFERKKITQTGAFYFKVLPKQVEIYLNGELSKKTDFFFGTAYIENLLPKKYNLKIEKEDYHPWEKTLEIKEKEVTETKNIVLIPKNPEFNILFKEVENFWFSPDEKKIILREENPPADGGWALKLFDLERNVKSHLIDEKDISKKGAELFDLSFSTNSKKISLEIGTKEQLKHFLLDINKTPPLLTESEEPLLPFEDIVTSKTIGQDIYYLNYSGRLFKNKERLTEKSFSVKPETKYELYIFSEYIFLQEDKILYELNPNSKSFEKFFEPTKTLKISPDLKKIVYFNNYEIWILFLDSDPSITHQKGDRVFLTRFSEKIDEVFWYTSNYLIFNVEDKIKIAEIDDRDRINIVDIAEFKNPKIFFNKNAKKLYLLSEGNLYESQALLP